MSRLLVLTILLGSGGCSHPADPRHKMYPKGMEHYRLLRDGEFCSELPLFAAPDPKTMLGTVLDGAQHYIDPQTGRQIRAIRLLTVVDGKRVDRWYPRQTLVGSAYVLRQDSHFGSCGYWLDRAEPVQPLRSEVAAELPATRS